MVEEVESSEEALELIQDNKEGSESTTSVDVIMAAHEQQQSRRFSTLLTEKAENISSAITNTLSTLTQESTEDIR